LIKNVLIKHLRNFNLRRHQARKTPCVFQPKINEPNDASGNTYNITFNNCVFVLGEESVTQFDIPLFIDSWRMINKLSNEPFVRSGKLLTTFHEMVKQQPQNKNIVLKSTKAMKFNDHKRVENITCR